MITKQFKIVESEVEPNKNNLWLKKVDDSYTLLKWGKSGWIAATDNTASISAEDVETLTSKVTAAENTVNSMSTTVAGHTTEIGNLQTGKADASDVVANTDMSNYVGAWKSGNDTYMTVVEGANHTATITVLDNTIANRTRAFLDLSRIAIGSKLHIEIHYTLNGGAGSAPKLYGIDDFDMAGSPLVDAVAGGDIAGVDGVYSGTFIKGKKYIAFNNTTFVANDVLEITSLSITKIDTVSQLSEQTAELNSSIEGIEEDLSDLETIRANAEDKAVTKRKEFVLVGGRRYDKRIDQSGVVSTESSYYFVAFDNSEGGEKHRWKLSAEGTLSSSNYYLTISHGDTIPTEDGDTVDGVLYSRKYDGGRLGDVIVESNKRYVFLCFRTIATATYITDMQFTKEMDNIVSIASPYRRYILYLGDLGHGALKGFISPEGETVSYNGDYRYSINIDVRGIDYIEYYDGCTSSSNYPNASSIWLDKDKNFLGRFGCFYQCQKAHSTKKIIRVPSGAAYARFSFYKNITQLGLYSKVGFNSFLEKATQTRTVIGENANNEAEYAVGILHISDIHGDQYSQQNIELLKGVARLKLPNTMFLCTGDVADYYADSSTTYPNGTEWWKSTQLADYFFQCLGNHDGATEDTTEFDDKDKSAAWDGKGKEWEFDNYYAPYISRVGYDMPSGYDDPESPNYKAMYWKKDYASRGIRVIGLDCMHYFDGVLDPTTGEITSAGLKHLTNEQELWLISTLNETLDSNNTAYGYSVVICGHYPLDDFDGVNNATNTSDTGGAVYSAVTGRKANMTSYSTNSLVLDRRFNYRNRVASGNSFTKGLVNNIGDIIENWRSNGGKFVCFLAGHLHNDLMFYPTKYPNLLTICVNQAGFKRNGPAVSRLQDMDNYSCFNYLSIRPDTGRIYIVKAGYVGGVNTAKKEILTYDYINREVIFEG